MIEVLPLKCSHLLSRTLLLTSYEVVVSKTVEHLIRAGCDDVTVCLNPAALRFTLSAREAPSHPPKEWLGILSAQCSVEYRSKHWTAHMRGAEVLEERTNATCNQGCELDVWEMFCTIPVRRRLQQGRDHVELMNATKNSIVPIVFANPDIRIRVQTSECTELLSWMGNGLTADTIEATLGTYGLCFAPIRLQCKGKLVSGFVARAGCSNSRLQYAALDGESGAAWLSNIVKTAWKKITNCKGARSRERDIMDHIKLGRHAAFVIHCTTREGRKTQISKMDNATELSRELRNELIVALFHELMGTKKRRPERGRDNYVAGEKRTDVLRRPRFEETKLRRRTVSPSIPIRRFQIGRRGSQGFFSESLLEKHVGEWCNPTIKNCATMGLRGGRWEQKSMFIEKERLSQLRVVGQVDRKFIVVSDERGLFAVDQHAASERDLFERFLSKAKQKISSADCHESLTLSRAQKEVVVQHSKTLRRWGWRLEIRADQVLITGCPCVCDLPMTKSHLLDVLDEICENDQGVIAGAVPRFVWRTVATVACHKAVRFGDHLSFEQSKNVIQALTKCDNPFCCAHGRPSIVPLATFES